RLLQSLGRRITDAPTRPVKRGRGIVSRPLHQFPLHWVQVRLVPAPHISPAPASLERIRLAAESRCPERFFSSRCSSSSLLHWGETSNNKPRAIPDTIAFAPFFVFFPL